MDDRSGRASLSIALCAILLTACGTSGPASPSAPPISPAPSSAALPSATPPAATPVPTPDDSLHLVVIGDSIPFGGHFCPGCTAFVARYAADLETRIGRPVTIVNRSRDDGAGMAQIEEQVTKDETTRAQIAAADVVIVSVGYNNALPDATTGVGCKGDMGQTIESYVTWALATKPACLKAGIDTYAAQYDRIFSAITELRKGAPTLYAAINVHDGNLGDPAFVGADLSAETRTALDRWIVAAYERWNPMLCDKAKQHGFACVDVYHAFNGPKGDKPSGANTIDGAHPSQAGNDIIAALLAKLDSAAISR